MRSKLALCLLFAAMLCHPLQSFAATSFCGDGNVDSAIGEECDVPGGTFCCIACKFQPTTTVCRFSTGVCDLEEHCSGSSSSCPADSFKPTTTVCRDSPGSLSSQVESTRGPNDPATTGTVASSSATFSFKVGTSGTLQTATAGSSSSLQSFVDALNALQNTAPSGQKVTASLINSGNRCQADSPGNINCLSNADCSSNVDCDTTYLVLLVGETRGANYTINVQTDQTKLQFALLRSGVDDVCNPVESCDGSTASCPADVYQNSSFVCRASTGSCDVVEHCPNNPASICPADTVVALGTECRPSAGFCDPSESCNGQSGVCPADTKSTAVCRPSGGSCDPEEACDGVADDCPADTLTANGTVCRESGGICDTAETCDGVTPACPADAFDSVSTVCRASVGQCDASEFCSGSTSSCPPDVFDTDGTPCDDGDGCTVSDSCQSAVCVGQSMHCGDGTLQVGCAEQCDDGNLVDGDGCSSTCQAETGLGCASTQLTGCRVPAVAHRAKLQIKDEAKVGGLKFTWKWKGGAATTEAEFGDPTTPAGASYVLCVYDPNGLLVQARAPAGGMCNVLTPRPCWNPLPSPGFTYLDPSQSAEPDGVRSIKLIAGTDGRAAIDFTGQGGLFPFPSNGGFGGIADLTGIVSPLTVQLQNTDGLCFEAVYSAPYKRQQAGLFQARAD